MQTHSPRPLRHAACAALLVAATALGAIAGDTHLVSGNADGELGNDISQAPAISDNGRFIAFESRATNLVGDDTNGVTDIFVYDRKRRQMERVSVDSSGVPSDDRSGDVAISGNGRFVAFESSATNLVERDRNGQQDIFVHDRKRHVTTLVSLSTLQGQARSECYSPAISRTGRFVAFASSSNSLVGDVDNTVTNVFVRDVKKRTTTRISSGLNLRRADGLSGSPAISGNGRFVAFASSATNLVAGDSNEAHDVFVYDRKSGATTRVSVGVDGEEANGGSANPQISANGRMIVFRSSASNLVSDDDNDLVDIFVHDRKRGTTTRVSVSVSGGDIGKGSYSPQISANGRAVSFYSSSPDLVDGDTNDVEDIFVRDLRKRRTTRVTVASDGTEADYFSEHSAISRSGRFIAFETEASNLFPGDGLETLDVFVHDRK